MGATLGVGGVNPVTGDQVVERGDLPAMCSRSWRRPGFYETSGDWLYDVGLPGKSGIGGGDVTITPGKGGARNVLAPAGWGRKGVRGQLAARFLSRALGLDIFASRPRRPPRPRPRPRGRTR